MSRSPVLLAAVVTCASGCSFEPPSAAPDAMPDTPGDEAPIERATLGLVALWKFDETGGGTADDTRMAHVSTPAMTPIPLQVSGAPSVTWRGGGLELQAPVRVGTPATTHVNQDVLSSGEVTLEAWVSPASLSQGEGTLPNGPNYALVFAISPSYAYHNAMIAQVGDRWQGRVLTAATTPNALPVIETPPGAVALGEPVHLALVASATDRVLYVNGEPYRIAGAPTGIGPLNQPPQPWVRYFPISLGQERDYPTEPRSWLGTIWMAAIYNRALTPDEVRRNQAARHDCGSC